MGLKTRFIRVVFLPALISLCMGCSEPLSKREQGGVLGLGAGAGTGAIIGSTVGHAAVGALIGGPIGLIGGALIGDQLMGQDKRQDDQQRVIDRNRDELEQLRRENQRLRERGSER